MWRTRGAPLVKLRFSSHKVAKVNSHGRKPVESEVNGLVSREAAAEAFPWTYDHGYMPSSLRDYQNALQ